MAKAQIDLILPDAHFPHHDPAALGCVLHAAEYLRPDRIVILGDWLDASGFSTHPPLALEDSKVSFLRDEVAPCNATLDQLQRYTRHLVYLEGNHEQRVERFAARMPGRQGEDWLALAHPQQLLRRRVGADGTPGTPRKRFTWVPYLGRSGHSYYPLAPETEAMTALIAVHGWTHASNAAQVHMRMARSTSIVYGHTHRAQTEVARIPLSDKPLYSWSPGCLTKLVPLYQATSPNTWTQGFSVVFRGRRSWTPYTVTIHPGGWCVLPDGREVRG